MLAADVEYLNNLDIKNEYWSPPLQIGLRQTLLLAD
jgi:hypothetical protein